MLSHILCDASQKVSSYCTAPFVAIQTGADSPLRVIVAVLCVACEMGEMNSYGDIIQTLRLEMQFLFRLRRL
jgi:hypothetical protein